MGTSSKNGGIGEHSSPPHTITEKNYSYSTKQLSPRIAVTWRHGDVG